MASSGFTRLGNLPGYDPSKNKPQTPTDAVQSFQNQRLPGLSTGTGARVGDQGASPSQQLLSMRRPETGVELSAKRTNDAVRLTNRRLLQSAQTQGAKRRAAAQAQPGQAGGYRGRPGGWDPRQGGQVNAPRGGGGGKAVSRVQSVLGRFPGLRITETLGDRAYDQHHGVPRGPNSYHYDAQNPAVDIAGPPAQLHQLYKQLVAMGGWRQILWQVPGHYDHIHIA